MNSAGGDSTSGDSRESFPHPSGVTPLQIIDIERAQIGHDIHDLLIPLIFAASANLQAILRSAEDKSAETTVDPSLVSRIEKSDQWLQQALVLGRNLLTQIYPPELDQLTWLAAAKDTAGRICGADCELTWAVDAESPVCDPQWNRDVATSAYRILIESLRNAIRHGKAGSITIRCNPDELLIIDNGIGFEPGSVSPNRFGIRAMKGRAQLVGKTLTVDSRPGGPTTVRLEW